MIDLFGKSNSSRDLNNSVKMSGDNNNIENVLEKDVFDDKEILDDNNEKRVSAIFILDCSNSMNEDNKIDEVNDGIKLFVQELKKDVATEFSVDIGVVTMGGSGANLLRPISSIANWKEINLEASGVTPMMEALIIANDNIRKREEFYEDRATDYCKPWIILLTDGIPTDKEGYMLRDEDYVSKLHDISHETECLVYTFFVGDENTSIGKIADKILTRIATVNPENGEKLAYSLNGEKGNLKKLFLMLSKSVTVASKNVRIGKTRKHNEFADRVGLTFGGRNES